MNKDTMKLVAFLISEGIKFDLINKSVAVNRSSIREYFSKLDLLIEEAEACDFLLGYISDNTGIKVDYSLYDDNNIYCYTINKGGQDEKSVA